MSQPRPSLPPLLGYRGMEHLAHARRWARLLGVSSLIAAAAMTIRWLALASRDGLDGMGVDGTLPSAMIVTVLSSVGALALTFARHLQDFAGGRKRSASAAFAVLRALWILATITTTAGLVAFAAAVAGLIRP